MEGLDASDGAGTGTETDEVRRGLWAGERAGLSRHAAAAKAIDYMLKRWDGFARFLDDGRICLTNNAAHADNRIMPRSGRNPLIRLTAGLGLAA